MKIVIFSFTDKGCRLGEDIKNFFTQMGYDCKALSSDRLSAKYNSISYGNLKSTCAEAFKGADALIFIGACGIAVRHIAPLLQDKTSDPAVLVIDDNAKFVIPILSAHIGGANALSKTLAAEIGAIPVISTATDVNGRFAVDTWASENNLLISDMDTAKAVSAAILVSDIPIKCDFSLSSKQGRLPGGLFLADTGELGIYISYKSLMPFARTLRIIPRVLHVGIGCRKGIAESAISELLDKALKANHIDASAIKSISSIDLKTAEAGLLGACKKVDIIPSFYSAEELTAASGNFTASAFVKSVTGVDNVCERAAVLSSGGGRLILTKTSQMGVSIAIARENWEAVF